MRLLATIPLALALLVWSLATIVIDGQASGYRDIAKGLERGGTAPGRLLSSVVAGLKTETALAACSRDTGAQRDLTISLAALDAAVASGDARSGQTRPSPMPATS